MDCRERRGRNRCWQLGRVGSSKLMAKTKSCLSTPDQVNGRGTVAKVCQALRCMQSSERIDEARALLCP